MWHETYILRAGDYESIYIGMPPHGLGRIGQLKPVTAEIASSRNRVRKGRQGKAKPPCQA
ncbi:MAG: monooxygenase family protein [Yoonia sp.]|uniref:monooxygenase family protein n=1 Tax=Yoonia sp. TaxID=2212373 RepID=UPI003EF8EE58